MVTLDTGGLQLLEIVRAEIAVRLAFAEHVIQNDQDPVRHRDHGFLFASPPRNPVELGGEVVVFGMADGPGHLPQHRPEVGIAVRRLAAQPLAATLFVARTDG